MSRIRRSRSASANPFRKCIFLEGAVYDHCSVVRCGSNIYTKPYASVAANLSVFSLTDIDAAESGATIPRKALLSVSESIPASGATFHSYDQIGTNKTHTKLFVYKYPNYNIYEIDPETGVSTVAFTWSADLVPTNYRMEQFIFDETTRTMLVGTIAPNGTNSSIRFKKFNVGTTYPYGRTSSTGDFYFTTYPYEGSPQYILKAGGTPDFQNDRLWYYRGVNSTSKKLSISYADSPMSVNTQVKNLTWPTHPDMGSGLGMWVSDNYIYMGGYQNKGFCAYDFSYNLHMFGRDTNFLY